MKNPVLALVSILLALSSASTQAAEFAIEFTLPKIDTAEYHRPYVAIWLEDSERRPILQIAHWLEQEKWHRDLRSWWRRGGSKLPLPVDGVTSATRKPGVYTLSASKVLAAGRYHLNIEAVREVGGREHLRIPFEWQSKPLRAVQHGKTELGQFVVNIYPEKLQ